MLIFVLPSLSKYSEAWARRCIWFPWLAASWSIFTVAKKRACHSPCPLWQDARQSLSQSSHAPGVSSHLCKGKFPWGEGASPTWAWEGASPRSQCDSSLNRRPLVSKLCIHFLKNSIQICLYIFKQIDLSQFPSSTRGSVRDLINAH